MSGREFRYRMETPCADCPFSESEAGQHLARTLRPGRMREIKRALASGGDFHCHKTTDETGDGSNLPCAGAIAWQEAHGASGQLHRIGERLAAFRSARKAIVALLLALLPFTASAEPRCRANSDGSWESYDSASGVTLVSGGASGCPGSAPVAAPPVVVETWVPALPTVGWYGPDLYAGAEGPRGDLTPYECGGIGSGGCKWRSRTICNTSGARLTVVIPVDGGIGVAQPTSQMNATITVCRGGDCKRPGHENIAWPASSSSQHNAVMMAWAWPGDCYQAEFYIGLPEFWWEVSE